MNEAKILKIKHKILKNGDHKFKVDLFFEKEDVVGVLKLTLSPEEYNIIKKAVL